MSSMSKRRSGEGEESKIFGKDEIIKIVPLKRVDPENDIEFRHGECVELHPEYEYEVENYRREHIDLFEFGSLFPMFFPFMFLKFS